MSKSTFQFVFLSIFRARNPSECLSTDRFFHMAKLSRSLSEIWVKLTHKSGPLGETSSMNYLKSANKMVNKKSASEISPSNLKADYLPLRR